MAACKFSVNAAVSLSLLLALLGLQGVLGGLECEKLPAQMCAFSVSATGARCVLEKYVMKNGSVEYECQSSEIIAEKVMEWIESEECMEACGLERMSVGVSSDALLEPHFTDKLCSPQCQNNCPNIVDLYLNLAAGEGIYLPHLCEAHRAKSRQLISKMLSEAKTSITINTHTFNAAPAPAGTPSAGDLKASIPSTSPAFAPIHAF
eukprot:Gb_37137 [translate_table: standard]